MRKEKRSTLVLLFFLSCVVFFGWAVLGQTKPSTSKEKDYERLIYSVKGPELYRAYCATCHGLYGKGNGPAAPALKAAVPDLTLLAKNSRGQFPEERIRKIISGDAPTLLSHGSREMPVWGPIFHQIEEDQDFGNVRLQNLTKFLESIQVR